MSWLNNFKIAFKVGLIVVLMAVVAVGTVSVAALRMRAMDDANTDMVTRIDKSSTSAARAARRAEHYISSAFQLLLETTDAGNAGLLAQTAESRKDYESRMAQILKVMPEKAGTIGPVIASFEKAFAACDPVIRFASTSTTTDENLKAAARLKAECVPLAEAAIGAQGKMVDGFLAEAEKASDQMTVDANSAIRSLFIASGVGLLLSLAVALWIGVKGLARPIASLKAVM
jgi:hypothetical protein